MVYRLLCRLSFVLVLVGLPMFGIHGYADEAPLSDDEKKKVIQDIYKNYKRNFPEVKDVSAEEALNLAKEQKVVFVDIRDPKEQAVSKIPGAITEKMLTRDPTIIKDKTAIAYCTIGYRSGIFAEKMGILDVPVSNLAGGILAWVHAGGKVYDDKGESNRLHVFGKKWDYAPDAYETITFSFWQKLRNL